MGKKKNQKLYMFPGGSVVKNPPAKQEMWVQSLVRKIPWRRKWQPTLVFLPGKSHEQRTLVGYNPWSHKGVGHDLATKQQHICKGFNNKYIIPKKKKPTPNNPIKIWAKEKCADIFSKKIFKWPTDTNIVCRYWEFGSRPHQ